MKYPIALSPWRQTLLAIAAAASVAVLVSGRAEAQQGAWSEAGLSGAGSLVASGGENSVLMANLFGSAPRSTRSTDGGRTWTEFTVEANRPQTFIASPSNAQVFYAMSGGYLTVFSGLLPARLHRSGDGGRTWQLISNALSAEGAPVLGELAPGAQAELIYAANMQEGVCAGLCTYVGLTAFVSKDGGRTWRNIHAGLPERQSLRLIPSPSDSRVVYAATTSGVYRSGDQGETWRLIRSVSLARQVVVDRRDPNTIYVRPGRDSELWVTEDGGATWRTSNTLDFAGTEGHLLADPIEAGRVFVMGPLGQTNQSRDRGRTWESVAPASGGGVLLTQAAPPFVTTGEIGRVLFGLSSAVLKRIEVLDHTFGLGSDLWWNPAESGSGFTITQHPSGQIFMVSYGYDAAGQPTWRFMSGGAWQDGSTFVGPLYATHGAAYFDGTSFDPSRVTVQPLGQATLRFENHGVARFSFQLADGSRGEKRLERQLFGPPSESTYENFADLWWNPSESGWGIAINHQFGKVFGTWFVYEGDGSPTWLVMPDMNYSAVPAGELGRAVYTGLLYTTRGPSSIAAYDPASVSSTAVGSASIVFLSSEEAILSYSAFGRSGTKRIYRQPF